MRTKLGKILGTILTVGFLCLRAFFVTAPAEAQAVTPDLAVTITSAPTSANTGSAIQVKANVANVGSATANPSYSIMNFIYPTGAKYYMVDFDTLSLAPGANEPVGPVDFTVPDGIASGAYQICLTVNPVTGETNTANNTACAPIQITLVRPDLAGFIDSVPTQANTGSSIAISTHITNVGTEAAGQFLAEMDLVSPTGAKTYITRVCFTSVDTARLLRR